MNTRTKLKYLFGITIVTTGCLVTTTSCASSEKSKLPPNIILILADDMGYSDLGCYGSEIPTPHIDQLAREGLQFTQMYSCGRCWPSRATLMTGHYARAVNTDPRDQELGSPGWIKYVPQYMKGLGYLSYHSGKWHIPDNDPIQAGFEHSYFNEGWDRHFTPKNHNLDGVSLPQPKPEDGYYSTIGITDYMIDFIKTHHADHPDSSFFGYLAYISPHFPLHALQEDMDLFKNQYLVGWDAIREQRFKKLSSAGIVDCELSPRLPGVKPKWNMSEEKMHLEIGPGEAAYAIAWNELTEEQKQFQSGKMAIHAAMIYRIDQEVGRLISTLKKLDLYENTVILFVSDNGASAEQMIRGDMHNIRAVPGSAASYLCLGPGWSTAANTPFKRHKYWMNEGGISSPFIMNWPEGIKSGGELRSTICHFTDILPTILELAGGSSTKPVTPELPGISLVPALSENISIDHNLVYFDHAGNKAIRKGKWKLVSAVPENTWELYDMVSDRSEIRNLSSEYPNLVQSLENEWISYQARLDSLKRNTY